jgi:hypothetical protein
MRILIGFVLVAAAAVAIGPSSRELHKRYGVPVVEGFIARPGVSVTVQYGPDGLVCEARISPVRSLEQEERRSLNMEESSRHMSSQAVSEVLDEIAPPTMRGQEINSGSFQASCGAVTESDYENVYIKRGIDACAPDIHEKDGGTLVFFKRDTCPKHEPEFIKR